MQEGRREAENPDADSLPSGEARRACESDLSLWGGDRLQVPDLLYSSL